MNDRPGHFIAGRRCISGKDKRLDPLSDGLPGEGGFKSALVELFLTVAVIGQVQPSEARGQVVDENGKPIAGVPVVFTDPFAFKPVVLPTQTDGEGRFRIIDLPTGPGGVWTYRPGSTIVNAGRISQRAMVLQSSAADHEDRG